MDFSSVKHFLFSAILGSFCMLYLSGCIAMVIERPLSEANEFQDGNLEGVWMMADEGGDSKSKEVFVFEIKNIEKHHYALVWMLPNKVTFTISRIPDGKSDSYHFASIVFDDPEKPENVACMLVRYASSSDKIGIFNVTEALQGQEDYKKLCKDPKRPKQVTAGSDEIRKWCKAHAGEMELLFVLKRIHFKTEKDRQRFFHISTFFQGHARRMAVILAGTKDSDSQLTEEQQKKLGAELEAVKKWVSGSGEMISPELAVIFDQYSSIQTKGRKGKELHNEIDMLSNLIQRILYLQVLN